MSIWIRAFVEESVANVESRDFVGRMHQRLYLLSLLYDVEGDQVDLSVDLRTVSGGRLESAVISFAGDSVPARVWRGGKAKTEIDEFVEMVESDAQLVSRLNRCTEVLGFELRARQASEIAFAIAIAAAASLVEQFGGVVQADGDGWLIPTEKEVKYVSELRT